MIAHPRSHAFTLLMLAVGAGALAWMLHRLGLHDSQRVVRATRWWFAAILGLDLLAMGCDAAALHLFMRPEARTVSFWRVLAAQASGMAVNIVTPAGKLGEATKVTMLVGHAPRNRAISSVVLFNLANAYLSVAIILVGVPLAQLTLDLPPRVRIVTLVVTGVLAALAAGIGILVHRGLLGTSLDAATRLALLPAPRAEIWKARLRDIDRHLRELHVDRTPATRVGFVLIGASRVLSCSGTIAVLHAVGVPLSPSLVLGVLTVGMLINGAASIVPLGLGMTEGGNYALFTLLGAAPASGLGVAMVNRARRGALALGGLAVMLGMHTATRIALARRNTRMALAAAALHKE